MTGTLPPSFYARCTDPKCSWEKTTTQLKDNDDAEEYRDALAASHTRHYGHEVSTTNYP